jgi:hypothetical protein
MLMVVLGIGLFAADVFGIYISGIVVGWGLACIMVKMVTDGNDS